MGRQLVVRTFVVSFMCGILVVMSAVQAAGGRSDYDRAGKLRSRFSNKVFRDNVKPNWLSGGTKFWYKVNTAPGTYEYMLVDAEKGSRQPAFDHAALAKGLSKTTSKDFQADRLNLDKLLFDVDNKTLEFQIKDKVWQCDLASYKVKVKSDKQEASLPAYIPKTAPKRSSDSQVDRYLTFINRMDKPIRLLWKDLNGQRIDYGSLLPGKNRRQHSFEGHVWLVTDLEGNEIAVYIVNGKNSKAVIGLTDPVPYKNNRPQQRRKRNGPDRSISPDKQWKAFIKNHCLWIKNQNDGKETQLSFDGSADNTYTSRFRYSPDSKKLVVLRKKLGEEHKVHFVESSPKDQVQPKLHTINYPKPGDRLDIERPCLFDLTTLKEIPVSNKLFANPWEVSDLRWEKDSKRFTFLFNQRGHQVLRIVAVDADSGAVSSIVEENSDTFICYSSKQYSHYLDDTGEILWMSERDGWNHLYLYDAKTGKVKNQITKGPWVVRDVEHIDVANRQIVFKAGGIHPEQDPYYIHYARINFDGKGLTLLTDGDGTHSVRFSPDRKYYIDTYSRVNMPHVTELRDSKDGRKILELERADWDLLLKAGFQVPEPFVAKGRDGATDIYGVIYWPTNIDPAKKYPVIEYIYAGPHSAFTQKSFRSYLNVLGMAELGFIVVQCDGMGTSHRSKAFHDVCWQNLADSGFPDRIAWIKAAAQKYPYMDISRVGIYGGSAGGQSSTCAVMTHGDFYKAAVSDCGCHDNRMDKVWWNEQWMGYPVGPHYAANSNVTLAKGLKGKLMLVVGEMDTNVDPASTMQVVNALIKADKDFDLLVVPGAGHGAGDGRYGRRRRADFFVRHLLGVEPRTEP